MSTFLFPMAVYTNTQSCPLVETSCHATVKMFVSYCKMFPQAASAALCPAS